MFISGVSQVYFYAVPAHLEEMCRPPGSRVIYSAGCKIILVLLTVHSLMDRLRRGGEKRDTKAGRDFLLRVFVCESLWHMKTETFLSFNSSHLLHS